MRERTGSNRQAEDAATRGSALRQQPGGDAGLGAGRNVGARELRAIAARAAARARMQVEAAAGGSGGSSGGATDWARANSPITPAASELFSSPHVGLRAVDSAGGASGAAQHEAASSERHGTGGATNSESKLRPSRAREDRDLVGESLVRAAAPGSEVVIPPGSRITPLARDLAFERGIRFVTGRHAEPSGPAAGSAAGSPAGRGNTPHLRSLRIAVASDHGGFALKDELLPLLKELGHRPQDLGPAAASPSVDYPDFAAAVAAEVSAGRADIGIAVDGAGIGSAIVCNKLPGVFAANCWNEASARNAREHNHANVLTLGSGHLDLAAARGVVAAFLSTPHGPDRHARRAAKTRAVETNHLRVRELTREFDEER